MPKYRSVELICALVTGYGLKPLVVVIYQPGSKAADIEFFNDLSDMLKCLAQFSSPVVAGDLNLHLDISECRGNAAIVIMYILLYVDIIQCAT